MNEESVPLKEYYDSMLREQDRRVQQQFVSTEQAITLAREQVEIRLEGMNEWRQSLSDLTNTFTTRTELEAKMNSTNVDMRRNTEELNNVNSRVSNLEGRMLVLSGGVGIFSIAVSIVLHFLH